MANIHHVLVTGGAGYIGSHTVLALLEQGYAVTVIDQLRNGEPLLVPSAARLIVGDYADPAVLLPLLNQQPIDAVMHFAGSLLVAESTTNPLAYYQNNTIASHYLLTTCREFSIRYFIFSSSAAVYGISSERLINEDALLAPINPYGRSKLAIEWMLQDIATAYPDFHYVALRYFNVAGADLLGRSGEVSATASHLIKAAAQFATQKRHAIHIFGTDYPTPDGTCIRDYIHVTDLADAHVKALDYLVAGGTSDVFNCGYGQGFSVKDVLAALALLLEQPFTPQLAARRPGDPPCLVANSEKIKKVLQWQPKLAQLTTLIHSAIEWEKQLP